jgi:hypothetical protein
MHRINLFSDTQRFGKYKRYAFFTKVASLTTVIGGFIIFVGLIIILNIRQMTYNRLFEQIPKVLRTDPQDVKSLSDTAFSYQKLQAVKGIYYSSPEYYKQYRYVLDIVSKTGKFTIDNFAMTNKNEVVLDLTSEQLGDIFAIIAKLNSDSVSKYMSVIILHSVTLKSSKDESGKTLDTFGLSLRLQFNPIFNEANI